MIQITPMEPVRDSDCVVLHAKVAGHPRGDVLEMRFPRQAEPLLSLDRFDAWLLAMLVPAMETMQPLHIEGPVSERLLFYINKHVVPLLAMFNSGWTRIPVTAAGRADPIGQKCHRGAATGFSGGVDSFVTVKQHMSKFVPDSLQLDLLLFCSTGQFGSDRWWLDNDRRIAKQGARQLGLKIVDVETNMDSFFLSSFTYSHTIRNLSVPLAMQSRLHTYLYSAGVPYVDTAFLRSDIAYIDSILIPMLSTETLTFLTAGGEYTRSEKTALLSEMPESYSTLYVCLRGFERHRHLNCSSCSKCLRTMLTLDVLGALDKYRDVFDIEKSTQKKALYVKGLSSSSVNYADDIISLAARRGKVIPRSWKAQASTIRGIKNRSPAWLRWRLMKRFPATFVR